MLLPQSPTSRGRHDQVPAFFHNPANQVAFQCYFDVNAPEGRHQLSPGVPGTGKQEGTEFPQSAPKFRELFRTQFPTLRRCGRCELAREAI